MGRLLASQAPLSKAEQSVIESSVNGAAVSRAGEEILAAETGPVGPRFLVSGWGCLQRVLPDGRRQILSFLLPGDLISARRFQRARGSASLMAITPVETVDAARLTESARGDKYPAIRAALGALAVLEETYLFDHIVRLGRQTAYERIAHLLLELRHRLALVGAADDHTFPIPLTQETLADSLGLSIVHLNRVLQQLRREGMVELKGGLATLPQPEVLAVACDFVPPAPAIS